jgi:hypothetical protein
MPSSVASAHPPSARPWVEIETIRAVIEAYGKGEIVLSAVPAKTPRDAIRHVARDAVQHPYTIVGVASFLGWTRKRHDGVQPNFACETAFKAIDMMEAGFLKPSDLKGLSGIKTSRDVLNLASCEAR